MNKNKPQLIGALTCDQVFTDQEGRHNIIGIFSNINATNFPAFHPKMSIFCAWLNNGSDEDYELRVIIDGPVKNPPKMETQIKFMGDKVITYAILNFVGITFDGEGECRFTMYLGEEKIATLPIIVGKSPKVASA